MAEGTKVTRIKATDSKKGTAVVKKSAQKPAPKKKTSESKNPLIRTLRSIGGYFKGAWFELKQVRWPTRSATWGMTIAVIIFSAFFAVLILVLDQFFQYIFKLIIN